MKKWRATDAFDYARNELSAEEKLSFEEAMAKDESLADALNDATDILTLTSSAKEASEAIHGRKILNDVMSPKPSTSRSERSVRWFVPSLAALSAAVVALVITSNQEPAYTPLWAFQPPPSAAGSETVVWLPLGDGSKVAPSSTSIWAVEEQNENTIALTLTTGKLTCEVAEDNPDRSFSVTANDVRVEVRGTQFSVEAEENGPVLVKVTQGKVAVQKGDREYILIEGETWDSASGKSEGAAGSSPGDSMVDDGVVPEPELDQKAPSGSPGEVGNKQAQNPPKTSKTKTKSQTQGAKRPVYGQEVRNDTVSPVQTEKRNGTVEIVIPHQQQPVPEPEAEVAKVDIKPAANIPTKGTPKVREVVQLIQNGKCNEALNLAGSIKPATLESKSDLLYLRGYCHHVSGDKNRAKELFKMMDNQEPGNPWLTSVGQWLNPPKPTTNLLR